MFASTSNSQKLYQSLRNLKERYEEYKNTAPLEKMMDMNFDCSLYSGGTDLEEWKNCRDELINLIELNKESLQVLNMIMSEVENYSHLVELAIYKKLNRRVKNPFERYTLPEMTSLKKIADNSFASNELKKIDNCVQLDHINVGHLKYQPKKKLIRDCWLLPANRTKLSALLRLLDLNERQKYFYEIHQAIINNINADNDKKENEGNTDKKLDIKKKDSLKKRKEFSKSCFFSEVVLKEVIPKHINQGKIKKAASQLTPPPIIGSKL